MKIKKILIVGLFIILGFFVRASFDSAYAEGTSKTRDAWGGGVHAGFSPYLGLIGLELQQTNFALTIGLPASIGVRYYFDPSGTQWFLGTHVLHYDIEEDKTKDGVRYTEQKATLWGMGVGYKWRFRERWDLTLSLSLVQEKKRLKNSTASRTDDTVLSLPGITIGYVF